MSTPDQVSKPRRRRSIEVPIAPVSGAQPTPNIAPVVPIATVASPVAPVAPTPMTAEEMAIIAASVSSDEARGILQEHRLKQPLKTAYDALVKVLKDAGISFSSPPVMMLSPEDDEDGEDYVAIWNDGSIGTSEDDDEDEDEGDETPHKRGRAGRPPSLIRALREYMEDADVSQKFVANKLGITQGTISNWLNGTAEPQNGNADELKKLVGKYL